MRPQINAGDTDQIVLSSVLMSDMLQEALIKSKRGRYGVRGPVTALAFCDLSQLPASDWLVRDGASSRARPKR